jgi:LysM repeat protein
MAPGAAAAGKTCEYKVDKGDTVSRIARRAGVSEQNLVRANPSLRKNPNLLKVGQTLKLCRAKQIERGSPQKCSDGGRLIHHEVRKGQTLGGIAARYDVARATVRKHNKRVARRKNDMIVVGETLRICTSKRQYTHREWLKNGIQLAGGDGYNVRRPGNAWGTPTTVNGIEAALHRYREREPKAPLVQIGDISRNSGGPLRAHLSHQDGRDVDIGYVWTERDEEGNRSMDLPRTWELLDSFLQDEDVTVIFVDYRLQRRLYKHAQSLGVEQAELDRAFEYPRNGDGESVLHHWRGHRFHFHVRFKNRPVPEPEPEPESEPQAQATRSRT